MKSILSELPTKNVFPGYNGKFIHSKNNTFAYWEIEENSPLPEHEHPHEQVVNVLEGEYLLKVNGEDNLLKAGDVFVIPSNVKHSGVSKTKCRILDVFSPVREDYL